MKGPKLFNFVRQESSHNFKEVVPEATDSNISDLSNILFNDAYSPLLNEFVNNLINRIGLTIIRNKSFSNPLSILKKGSMPLGTDIQDIYENPAEAEQYQLNNAEMAKLLTITDPDTKVAYYRRNRKDMYTKTIAREALQGAFVSWNKFEDFISAITTSLYSGAYIDEFEYTKGLVQGAYENNKAIVKVVDPLTSEANAKSFIKTVRGLYKAMSFPSTEYNVYSKNAGDNKPVKTWTDKDRVVVVVRADVMTEVDVDVLAQSFNMDKADFLGRVIEVDSFGNDEILGIIADEAWFQIYDNIMRFDEFYNARTMAWNEYLHVWETFAICPFANGVILATSEPAGYSSIEFGTDTVEIEQGDHEGLDMTVAPETGNADINYAVTATPEGADASKILLTKSNKDRHVDIAVASDATAGEYTITAVSGKGSTAVSDTVTLTVTTA